jgi:hypothetical protein
MATKKISALTAKGFNIQTTDLLEISEYDGVSAYVTKKITGSEIINGIRNVLFYNDFESFPLTGSTDIIYVDKELEEIHLWTGVIYSQIGGGSSQNIATNDLVFTANSTTDLAGYKATLDNAEFKIVADANLNADIPFEITQADGTTKIFDIRGTGDVNIPAENMTINANDRSIFQPTMTMRGTGASKLNLANNTNNGLSLFGNSGQGQILHASGFIQYTVRDGLTADGNMELDGLTFAYDNATNDFKIKFKKADGTVVTKTIS